MSRRNPINSPRACSISLQTPVPTSITDWCISGFMDSFRRTLPLAMISISIWERRSRVSGSMVWYSSSMPIVKLGFMWKHRLPYGRGSVTLRASSRCPGSPGFWIQEICPAQLFHHARTGLGLLDGQIGYCIHDPLEVFRTHGMVIGVRRRIHKVDGIRHAILHREFHRVQIVAQSLAERHGIAHHSGVQRRLHMTRLPDVTIPVRLAWIVLHDVHFLLAHYVASKIKIEIDALLQSHAEIASVVVGREQLLRGIYLVDALPAPAAERFEKSRKSDVVENLLPVQRID